MSAINNHPAATPATGVQTTRDMRTASDDVTMASTNDLTKLNDVLSLTLMASASVTVNATTNIKRKRSLIAVADPACTGGISELSASRSDGSPACKATRKHSAVEEPLGLLISPPSSSSSSRSSSRSSSPRDRHVRFAASVSSSPAAEAPTVRAPCMAPAAADLANLWSSLDSIFDEVEAAVARKRQARQAATGETQCGALDKGVDVFGGLANFLDRESDGASGRWDDLTTMERESQEHTAAQAAH